MPEKQTALQSLPYDAAATGLRFITAKGTPDAKVHVVGSYRDGDIDTSSRYAEIASMMFFTRSLCGAKLSRSNHYETFEFDDEHICIRCHAALGEDAILIFER